METSKTKVLFDTTFDKIADAAKKGVRAFKEGGVSALNAVLKNLKVKETLLSLKSSVKESIATVDKSIAQIDKMVKAVGKALKQPFINVKNDYLNMEKHIDSLINKVENIELAASKSETRDVKAAKQEPVEIKAEPQDIKDLKAKSKAKEVKPSALGKLRDNKEIVAQKKEVQKSVEAIAIKSSKKHEVAV